MNAVVAVVAKSQRWKDENNSETSVVWVALGGVRWQRDHLQNRTKPWGKRKCVPRFFICLFWTILAIVDVSCLLSSVFASKILSSWVLFIVHKTVFHEISFLGPFPFHIGGEIYVHVCEFFPIYFLEVFYNFWLLSRNKCRIKCFWLIVA